MAINQYMLDKLTGSNPARHGTIAEDALNFTTSLIEELENGEINEGYGYGQQTYRSESITLAGGGPGAEIVFAFRSDDELDHAYICYIDVNGSYIVQLTAHLGEKLAEAFNVR